MCGQVTSSYAFIIVKPASAQSALFCLGALGNQKSIPVSLPKTQGNFPPELLCLVFDDE